MFRPIETERCRLRLFRKTDLPTFAQYRSDPDIAKYQSWSAYSYEDALSLYKELSGKAFGLMSEWYQIALADKAKDEILGDVAVHFITPEVAEIGFTVAPRFQRMGYGKEGVRGLLGYLFGELAYQRVIAVADARNLPSIAVLESVGFQRAPGEVRQVMFKGKLVEEFDYLYPKEHWLLQR